LEVTGAVERVDGGQAFRVGPAMRQIAGSVTAPNLESLSRPHLVHLVREVGEAAGFSVRQGFDALYILQVDADQDVQVRDWTGAALSMHLVSAGIAMLSTLPEDEVEEFLDLPLDAPTAKSVTDPGQIRQRLAEARRDRVAWTRDELVDGLTSVACAVKAESGELIGAVHMHGPSFRFPRARESQTIVEALQKTALGIAASVAQAG
ncbi:MAG: hypothetical protein HKN07_16555, partial [Acidimicrobiia bacterium]|nr:hypothetical protein [Acidimicrobiia bacterium]